MSKRSVFQRRALRSALSAGALWLVAAAAHAQAVAPLSGRVPADSSQIGTIAQAAPAPGTPKAVTRAPEPDALKAILLGALLVPMFLRWRSASPKDAARQE